MGKRLKRHVTAKEIENGPLTFEKMLDLTGNSGYAKVSA